MKRKTVKLLKKASRERIPVSSLKGKVIPSKKRNLIEKILKKERLEEYDPKKPLSSKKSGMAT
jgi:hypothetical protein